MRERRSYLLILGEREAVAWVLRESRMAFPPTRRAEIDQLDVGDDLYVFTTRGCWHNPGRDRGRVIGHAEVTSAVEGFDEPVTIAAREFTRGCDLRIDALARYLDGVELAPLVPRLDAFPDPRTWSIRLRRPLLELSGADAELLRTELAGVAADPRETAPEYLARIRPVARA